MERNIIYDNHGRPITYLRIAVTDRCNLRCFYCMPAEGIQYLPKKELLTYEEMERLVKVCAGLGVNKIRITGGEPFVRRDLMGFLERISGVAGIEKVNITTNGVLTQQYLQGLLSLGITGINLSLDTLDPKRFFEITRRDVFGKVMDTFHQMVGLGFKVKVNAVVMEGRNDMDIIPLAELSQSMPVDIRFIEEMPFNGSGSNYPTLKWNFKNIYKELEAHFPGIQKLDDGPNSTSLNYKVPGAPGNIGIIPAFSRTFCGTCNRIRLTSEGVLKTCLYDHGVLDLKKLLRSGIDDPGLKEILIGAFQNRAKDGFEAEKNRKGLEVKESMSTIGG